MTFRVGQLDSILDVQGHYVSPEPNSGCWLWIGPIKDTGYGRFSVRDGSAWKTVIAHRYSYEAENGPIPEGLVIDHLCRMRCCVNPDHLEAITNEENIRRGFLARRQQPYAPIDPLQCINGHIYGPNGRTSDGHCRKCDLVSKAREENKIRRRANDKARYQRNQCMLLPQGENADA